MACSTVAQEILTITLLLLILFMWDIGLTVQVMELANLEPIDNNNEIVKTISNFSVVCYTFVYQYSIFHFL